MDISEHITRLESRVAPPEVQLSAAIESTLDCAPDEIILDGQIHRWDRPGKTKGKPLWYVAYSDSIPAGAFGDFTTGETNKWVARRINPITPIEQMRINQRINDAKKLREAEKAKKYEVGAETAKEIWANAPLADQAHPYLQRKGIGVNGARISGDGKLIVPMYLDDEISGLQFIDHAGAKVFLPGSNPTGSYWLIGEPKDKIYLAEGFATGATIHEVTGQAVAIAYSAHNLVNVAGKLAEKYPDIKRVIVADNDKSGVGKSSADQAAAKHGATIIMPPDLGDVNDYRLAGGDVKTLLEPPQKNWLIDADEFCAKPAPISWLIKGWLPQDAVGMYHGPSGTGKSFVILDMCCRIASGQELWDGQRVKQAPVVMLMGEGHHGTKGRIAAWKQHHGVKKLGQLWVSSSGCNLNEPGPLMETIQELRQLPVKPALVVVDTLHRFLSGDENSAQDSKTMLDACAELNRQFGCTVLLVHHTGNNAENQHRARGSSSWRGAMDFEASITKKGECIVIKQTKMKDTELHEDKHFDLQSVEINGWIDEDGEQVSSAVVVEGVPPKREYKKHDFDDMNILESAWAYDQYRENEQQQPFVSYSAMKTYLIERQGLTPAMAQKELKESGGGIIHRLTESGIVKRHEPKKNAVFYIIVNPVKISQLLMRKPQLSYSCEPVD